MSEFPAMCQSFFQMLGMQAPQMNDIMYLMFVFDTDKDGKISFAEFRNMLYYIGGKKQQMQGQQQQMQGQPQQMGQQQQMQGMGYGR